VVKIFYKTLAKLIANTARHTLTYLYIKYFSSLSTRKKMEASATKSSELSHTWPL